MDGPGVIHVIAGLLHSGFEAVDRNTQLVEMNRCLASGEGHFDVAHPGAVNQDSALSSTRILRKSSQ
jgi:hypothetical protein